MPASHAIVPTAAASRYLQQLCKHWSHKFAVEFTPEHGTIPFDAERRCTLDASPAGFIACCKQKRALRPAKNKKPRGGLSIHVLLGDAAASCEGRPWHLPPAPARTLEPRGAAHSTGTYAAEGTGRR